MEIEIPAQGDVVERTELLNGTLTVALEGQSPDGAWKISAVVSWNRGLVDYAGEGDITATNDDGELYASLISAVAEAGHAEGDEGDLHVQVAYDIDGGVSLYDGVGGSITGEIRVGGGRFEGLWKVTLD